MSSRSLLVANIGRAERRKRFVAGAIGLGVAAIVAALLLWSGAARPWRLVLLPLVYGGALGWIQARDRT